MSMYKKYKKIEYTGDMSNRDIVKEVFKQLLKKDSAVDLFEKMENLEISKTNITYGHFDIGFPFNYDGLEEDLETREHKERKGRNQIEHRERAVLLSDLTCVKNKEVLDIFNEMEIDNFERNHEFDNIAYNIVENSNDIEELKEDIKGKTYLWLNDAGKFFEGIVKVEDKYEVLDGTIIETNGLLIKFNYDGVEYRIICILKGDDCIIILDYPKEVGQGERIIKNANDPELVSVILEYNATIKNYEDMKSYENFVNADTWEKTKKSMEKLKYEYDKVINQYLTGHKKLSYEEMIKDVNNIKIEDNLGDGNVEIITEKNPEDLELKNVNGKSKIIKKSIQNQGSQNTYKGSVLDELNSLIGLARVKSEVKSMVDLITVNNKRKEMNLPITSMSHHLVFSGNPGTGKTTVARILAKIYKSLGIIKEAKVVEVDRSELVAGYVGQTAIKTQEVIDSAKGGILFIDEAYTLVRGDKDDAFGQEAIDTILKEMEDNRDNIVVIVAGYTDLMKKFISSNPGLESRFNKYIEFDDYTPDELYEILELNCKNKGYVMNEDAKAYAKEFFANRYNNRNENYANARDVRNFFEKAVVNQSSRIVKEGINNASKKDMGKITKEDLQSIVLK